MINKNKNGGIIYCLCFGINYGNNTHSTQECASTIFNAVQIAMYLFSLTFYLQK